MLKKIGRFLGVILVILSISGCNSIEKKPKIGVSFGVGGSDRWMNEKAYMEAQAAKLGADIEVRINTDEKVKTQTADCRELIDSGAKVLVITPRDMRNMRTVLDYARQKNVKVIAYARVIMDPRTDLFVGYDTYKIGQNMGKYLSERIYKGDFIILKGDEWDFNTPLLYNGASKYIEPMVDFGVKIIMDTYIPRWSREKAKEAVRKAILENSGKIDAILAPNDGLAGAAADAVTELGIKNHVVITGMDAELSAVKRLVAGTQDMTVYMDLKNLAETTVAQAYAMAKNEKITANTEIDIDDQKKIKAYLITGEMVTKENIDKVLIETGVYTKEQIYGSNK